ncbi:MAG: hypothetical protein L3J69_08200 [Desulfobacula sp.]|nr:hypothetical protein [Desulfobacula sp.]
MEQIRKIMFFLTILSLFFITSSVFLFDNFNLIVPNMAFAAEKKVDGDKTGKEENPCPECPECPDPAKVVLRGLEDKKTSIDKQQKNLAKQKKDLTVFEEQIDEKINQLQKLQNQIKSDMVLLKEKKTQKEQQKEAAYEARIGRLVKMYAGMKPKAAALIVNGLDLEVAQEIFLRMREASAGQILSFVDSQKAGKISERLAFRKK